MVTASRYMPHTAQEVKFLFTNCGNHPAYFNVKKVLYTVSGYNGRVPMKHTYSVHLLPEQIITG